MVAATSTYRDDVDDCDDNVDEGGGGATSATINGVLEYRKKSTRDAPVV